MNTNYYKLKKKIKDITKIDLLFGENIKDFSEDMVVVKLEKVLEYNLFSYYEKKEFVNILILMQ